MSIVHRSKKVSLAKEVFFFFLRQQNVIYLGSDFLFTIF